MDQLGVCACRTVSFADMPRPIIMKRTREPHPRRHKMRTSPALIRVVAIVVAIAVWAGVASAQKAGEKGQTAKVTLSVQGMT